MKHKSIVLFTTLLFLFTSCTGTKESHRHDLKLVRAANATCVSDGHAPYYECQICGELFDRSRQPITLEDVKIPALGHDLMHHEEVEGVSCSSHGVIEYWSCNRCHKNFSDDAANHEVFDLEGPVGPHHFMDFEATEATCLHKGNTAYSICTSCHKAFSYDHSHELTDNSYLLPKLPHNMTHHPAVLFETLEYWSCSMCGKNYSDEAGTNEITDIRDDSFEEIDILDDNLKNYLSAETDADIIESFNHRTPYNDQFRKQLNWDSNGSSSYTIELSTDLDFTNVKTYTSSTNSFFLPGVLVPGETYYWRVKDTNGNYVTRLKGFHVDDTYSLRTINVPGAFNFRDAGGWTGKDGRQIPYGKIYRGGRLTNVTDEGKDVFLNELGIKTEIDLRAGSDGVKEINDSRIDYHKCGFDQYTMIMPGYLSPYIQGKNNVRYGYNASTAEGLKAAFEILADENSYPVYFHCNAGADRTGTFAYILNGLLGVSYEDLTKDFELTTFSSMGNRWRSGVEDGHFVTEGEMAGIYQCNSDNYVAWGKLHELMMTNYVQENGSLCSAIEFYLKKVCNISDETIQAVRRNLLGEGVEFDPVVVPVDTTFTVENGNITMNAQVAYEKGTFYGKECYKFYTIGTTNDHYIFNNLAMINDSQYSTYHFEIYVPSECARWNTHQGSDTGPRFHFSIKSSSTNNIAYREDIATDNPNVVYHLDIDTWMTYELDISSYTNLVRFAFYLPYGTTEKPAVVYLRNMYVD